MVMLVHLAPEKAARAISRGGIKVSKHVRNKPNGVFAMPVTRRFVVSHQWLRELRRGPSHRPDRRKGRARGLRDHRPTQAQVAESFFIADGHLVASLGRLVGALMTGFGDGPWRHRLTLKRDAWSHKAL